MIATVSTELELATLALDLIGSKAELDSLADGSQEAKACARHLPVARELCLALADWPFAHRLVVLEELEVVASSCVEWEYAYGYPTDASAVWGVFPDARRATQRPDQRIPFDLCRATLDDEDGTKVTVIGCDREPEGPADARTGPVLCYTEQLVTPADWPAYFVDLVVAQLACRLAMPLAVDSKKRLVAQDALVTARRTALAYAGGQRTPDPEPEDRLTASRS
jgi:hypothetical protein